MKKLIFGIALLVSATIALEPFGIIMPSTAQMTAAGVLLALLVITVGVLWRENPRDERENEIYSSRARIAYLLGLSVGSVGIVIGAFTHHIDWWLVAVIGSMLAAKLIHKK
jgi:hypothetical protein